MMSPSEKEELILQTQLAASWRDLAVAQKEQRKTLERRFHTLREAATAIIEQWDNEADCDFSNGTWYCTTSWCGDRIETMRNALEKVKEEVKYPDDDSPTPE